MSLNSSIIANYFPILTTSVDGDYTVKAGDQLIEVDTTINWKNITITFPTVTGNFLKRPSILIRRIDESPSNIRTLNITSLTFAGGIATATTAEDHNLETGQAVDLFDATELGYNVLNVACTATGSTTFTYPAIGTPTSPATGSPKVSIVYFVKLAGTGGNLGVDEGAELDDVYQGARYYASKIDQWRSEL